MSTDETGANGESSGTANEASAKANDVSARLILVNNFQGMAGKGDKMMSRQDSVFP